MDMRSLVKHKNWEHTPLGPIESWPQSLYTLVETMLDYPVPTILLWGPELIQIYNDNFRIIAAEKHPEALGCSFQEYWPDLWQDNQSILNKALDKGEATVLEDQLVPILRNGKREEEYFTLSYSPVRDDDGRVAGVLLTFLKNSDQISRELTEQREKLRTRKNQFQALVDASSEVLYRMSPDWSEMRELGGGGFLADTKDPLKNWADKYIHPHDQEMVWSKIHEAIENKCIFELEHRVKRTDGSLGWTHSRAVPVLDENGVITEWFGAASDITERKETEQKLERRVEKRTADLKKYQAKLRSLVTELNYAEENQRRLLAEELHDNLGQILAMCKLNLNKLKKKDDIRIEYENVRKLLDDAIVYARNLVSDLKPPPAQDQKSIKEALDWIGRKMEKHQLEVKVEDDDKTKPLDEKQRSSLVRVVRELLFNVAKHAETDQAWVSARRINGQIQITVKDRGKGFHPEKQISMADNNFGLFNIQERINLLGGQFNLESEPGKGTTATISIPLNEELPVDDVIKSKKPINTAPQKSASSLIEVLIVDDHKMMRDGIKKIINTEEDMQVSAEAADGESAIDKVDESQPSVIIMDINLPGINGIEATKKIKTDYPHIKVVGLSFHNDKEIINKMYNAGASDFVSKDEALEIICQAIRDVN